MDTGKLAWAGAVAGAITAPLLKYVIVPILNALGMFTPEVSAKLANPTLEINIRQSLTGVQTGLGTWLANVFGVSVPTNIWFTIGMSAAGGAILFVLGGMAAEQLGLLAKGTATYKTGIVIFIGSLGAALILGTIGLPPAIGITLVNTLFAFGINAAILAWAYSAINDAYPKAGLIPF